MSPRKVILSDSLSFSEVFFFFGLVGVFDTVLMNLLHFLSATSADVIDTVECAVSESRVLDD